MCDEYELDNSVCDFDRGSKERERARFTFNLICKADQGNMYQDENDDGEVMVSWLENDFSKHEPSEARQKIQTTKISQESLLSLSGDYNF